MKKKIKTKTILRNSCFMIRKSEGFTLVELLIVVILLGIIGSMIGSILFASLRGSSKTAVLQLVRQNGNYAISQMAKTMRNAKNFNGVKVNIVDDYITDCTQSGTTQYKYVKVTDFTNSPVTFSCMSPSPSINGLPLINTASVTMDSCSFTCSQNSIVEPPNITFNLTLYQLGGGVTAFAEKNASLSFQTSISIRNFTR